MSASAAGEGGLRQAVAVRETGAAALASSSAARRSGAARAGGSSSTGSSLSPPGDPPLTGPPSCWSAWPGYRRLHLVRPGSGNAVDAVRCSDQPWMLAASSTCCRSCCRSSDARGLGNAVLGRDLPYCILGKVLAAGATKPASRLDVGMTAGAAYVGEEFLSN